MVMAVEKALRSWSRPRNVFDPLNDAPTLVSPSESSGDPNNNAAAAGDEFTSVPFMKRFINLS